ncbi:hypothetical protein BH09VER1_BH09VER1_30580 [soil metagenome]
MQKRISKYLIIPASLAMSVGFAWINDPLRYNLCYYEASHDGLLASYLFLIFLPLLAVKIALWTIVFLRMRKSFPSSIVAGMILVNLAVYWYYPSRGPAAAYAGSLKGWTERIATNMPNFNEIRRLTFPLPDPDLTDSQKQAVQLHFGTFGNRQPPYVIVRSVTPPLLEIMFHGRDGSRGFRLFNPEEGMPFDPAMEFDQTQEIAPGVIAFWGPE